MSYKVRGYYDGRVTAKGEYLFYFEALQAAIEAVCGVSGPECAEVEVIGFRKVAGLVQPREILLAHMVEEGYAMRLDREECDE